MVVFARILGHTEGQAGSIKTGEDLSDLKRAVQKTVKKTVKTTQKTVKKTVKQSLHTTNQLHKSVNHEVEKLQKDLAVKATKAKEQIDDVLLNLGHRVESLNTQKIQPKLKNGRIQAQSVSDLAINIAHGVSKNLQRNMDKVQGTVQDTKEDLVGGIESMKEVIQQQTVVRQAKVTAHKTKKKIRKAFR